MIPSAVSPKDAADFATAVMTCAAATAEKCRRGFNWQKGDARRWQRLAGIAASASLAKSPARIRLAARCAIDGSRAPKVKGSLRAAYRALAFVLFRAARWQS